MNDSDPVGIILASSGSKGESLLFRYPYETDESKETTVKGPIGNPYGVRISEDLDTVARNSAGSGIVNGVLVGYSDKILASLLAVKSALCGSKFELRINDVIFVGYPLLLDNKAHQNPKRETPSTISFNVVFLLRSNADEYMIESYQDLARQIAVALRHEERRCGYLNAQKTSMLAIQDDVAALTEDSMESPFKMMLQKCQLAKQLKAIYDNLSTTGVVQMRINKWIPINFCLPHKIHKVPDDSKQVIKPEAIQRCLQALRPYHAMLLLVEESSLLNSLPQDCSPALIRLIKVTSPIKRLQAVAVDCNITLGQVFKLVTHLIYWGKATIIFPLCESNVYMLAPKADTYVNSSLISKFAESFPGASLSSVLSDFSLPMSLAEHRDVFRLPPQQAQQVQTVIWLLQHRLLIQLHTYIFFLPRNPRSRSFMVEKTRYPALLSPSETGGKQLTLSDTGSVNSDGSPSQTQFGAKSPPGEHISESSATLEEGRAQRFQDPNLSRLPVSQRSSVTEVPASNNPEDLKLFARLFPYFDGAHHVEEIMYCENVTRSKLVTLLDKFRDVLMTCQHEDYGTSSWING